LLGLSQFIQLEIFSNPISFSNTWQEFPNSLEREAHSEKEDDLGINTFSKNLSESKPNIFIEEK